MSAPSRNPIGWILWPLAVFIVVVIIACCHGCATPRDLDPRDPNIYTPPKKVVYPTPT